MDTLVLLVSVMPLIGVALIGTAFVAQCILRGMGSIKGCPMPPRWWQRYDAFDEAIHEMHKGLGRE